jgi:hypothetical protein
MANWCQRHIGKDGNAVVGNGFCEEKKDFDLVGKIERATAPFLFQPTTTPKCSSPRLVQGFTWTHFTHLVPKLNNSAVFNPNVPILNKRSTQPSICNPREPIYCSFTAMGVSSPRKHNPT